MCNMTSFLMLVNIVLHVQELSNTQLLTFVRIFCVKILKLTMKLWLNCNVEIYFNPLKLLPNDQVISSNTFKDLIDKVRACRWNSFLSEPEFCFIVTLYTVCK